MRGRKQGFFKASARLLAVLLAALISVPALAPEALAYDPVTSGGGHWPTATTEWINKTKGTAQAPYVISTADDLAGLAKLCDEGNTFENKFFVLAADIDLGEKPWEPIGCFHDYLYGWNAPFNGTFDGRGYEIYGLSVAGIERDGALFGYIGPKGTVRNLSVEGSVKTSSTASAGAAILTSWLDGVAENCVIEGETSAGAAGGYRSFSGIVASLIGGSGTARNIITFGSVDSKNGLSYAGGIIGYTYASGTIENCVAEVTSLKAVMDAGGIVGGNLGFGKFYNCVSTAVSVTAKYPAGITVLGGIGENNFWLKELPSQPDYANPYDGNRDTTGRVSSRSELPIVAAAPLPVTRVAAGGTAAIAADLYPAGGNPAGITFTWKSANTKVATVESSGGAAASVTGVGVGSTTVTLTMANPAWKGKGRISVSCPVYVTEAGSEPDDPADLPDPGVEPGDPAAPGDTDDTDDTDGEDDGTTDAPGQSEPDEPGDGEGHEEDTDVPSAVTPVQDSETSAVKGTESERIAAVAGLTEGVFEADSEGNLVFSSVKASEIAQGIWTDEEITEVNPLPVVQASVGASGEVARIMFTVKGSSLMADRPENVRVMKIKRGGSGDSFAYARTGADHGDKRFTLMKGSHIYTGEIQGGDDYTLVLFVKDGGDFDLDQSPTRVLDPAVIVSARKRGAAAPSGGGCSAASGPMLAAAAAVLIIRRRRGNKS